MASIIQIKRGTGSAVPSGLADGELAINLDNGRLYFGSGSTSVNSFTFQNLTAENYIVSTSVTNITTQTLSGSTQFGDSADDIHQFTGAITASGNISSSGNIYANRFSDFVEISTSGNGATIAVDSAAGVGNSVLNLAIDGTTKIKLNKDAVATEFFGNTIFDSPITSSGNISSSGEIKANTLDIASTSNFADDITLGDTKKLKGVRLVISASSNNNIYGISTFHQNVNLNGGVDITGDSTLNGNLDLTDSNAILDIQGQGDATDATGDTGALRCEGGASIAKKLFVGTDLDIGGNITSNITASGNITTVTGTITGATGSFGGGLIVNGGKQIADGVSVVGDISASGTITANQLEADQLVSHVGDANTGLQFASDTVVIQGNDEHIATFATNRIEFTEPITASGNISSSGDIIASNLTTTGTTILGNGNDTTEIRGTLSASGEGTGGSIIVKNITASGEIRAIGDIRANETFLDNGGSVYFGQGTSNEVRLRGVNGELLIMSSSNSGIHIDPGQGHIQLDGNITASGDISSSGTVTANTLRLSSTTDASATSTDHAFQAGLTNSTNVIIDNNEVMARNNGAVSNLHFNPDGGNITFNNSTSDKVIIGSGNVTASGVISASNGVAASSIIVDGISALDTNATTGRLFVNSTTTQVDIGKAGTITSTVIRSNVTASGNISSSGTISGQAGLLVHSKSSAVGADAQGDVVYFGGGSGLTTGSICHYNSSGNWELADADDNTKSDGLLGVTLATAPSGGILLRGMVTLDHDPGAVGDALYLTTTAGNASATAPSGNGNIVRIIGYCLDASNGQIWFNPDSTFVEVNA